jgi:3-oxoacyl-[acyl-carrier protein] reductase
MVSPLLLIRAVIPAMRRRKFGCIINITSEMVWMPNPAMGLSFAHRSYRGVEGIVARDSRDNVTVNNILPFLFDTRSAEADGQTDDGKGKISWEEARKRQVENTITKRLGDACGFGATCTFLCSIYGGYICGQNILLDVGNFPGVF